MSNKEIVKLLEKNHSTIYKRLFLQVSQNEKEKKRKAMKNYYKNNIIICKTCKFGYYKHREKQHLSTVKHWLKSNYLLSDDEA